MATNARLLVLIGMVSIIGLPMASSALYTSPNTGKNV
jgi:hypothetical protein